MKKDTTKDKKWSMNDRDGTHLKYADCIKESTNAIELFDKKRKR